MHRIRMRLIAFTHLGASLEIGEETQVSHDKDHPHKECLESHQLQSATQGKISL